MISERRHLAQKLHSIEAEVEQAREGAEAAYRELKKFEIIEEHRVERERRQAQRRSQREQDEIAAQIVARRMN